MNAFLLALFIAIQIADVWTTWRAFDLGGEEAMPLGRALFAKLGFWPAVLLLKGVAIAVAILVTALVSNAYWFTGPLVLGGLYVLWNNLSVIWSPID